MSEGGVDSGVSTQERRGVGPTTAETFTAIEKEWAPARWGLDPVTRERFDQRRD